MKKRDVEYLDYHPTEWDRIFKKEYNNIHFLLPDMKIYVEHIGATSINGCRSFRNVDVLVSTQSFADIYTAKMLLCIDEYKELPTGQFELIDIKDEYEYMDALEEFEKIIDEL